MSHSAGRPGSSLSTDSSRDTEQSSGGERGLEMSSRRRLLGPRLGRDSEGL